MKWVLVSFMLFSIVSCSYAQKGDVLSPKEFSKAITATSNTQLVDVRTPEEFEEGYIGNALNIDWNGDNFDEEINKLDKNRPVYVYCRSGKRSSDAATHMRKAGFKNVYELKGGMTAWEREDLLKGPEKDKEEQE
jgi:rhodanese-related sulfurtransferase